MRAFSYCILLVSISASLAAVLDGDCNDSNRCDGPSLVCENGKCRCDTPLFRPCNLTCELSPQVSYEGDRCSSDTHCVEHMRCAEQKCVCQQNFHARNGLCYKTLNTTCGAGTECWSGYCINTRCACPVGYEANEDGIGCRRKLVEIYPTLEAARPTEAYCSDSSSCYDPVADCHNESNNSPMKFCKCPRGFRVTDDRKRCELVESPHFSPLTEVPIRYEECGTCKDSNAICMTAAQETTCWCRAGYRNDNGQCVNDRFQPTVIFPNLQDRNKYDYTASCDTAYNVTGRLSDRLCACSPGYRFVAKDRACRAIPLEWVNSALEYGLCTHIDSDGFTTPENGLCPSPLTCQARRDKYVCSCGLKQFRDIDDPSKCVYFIGETTANSGDLCPTKNAERNGTNGICQCRAGFRETNNRRQCVVELASEVFADAACSGDRSNDGICVTEYGNRARLCQTGYCRCDGSQAFPSADNKHCHASVDVQLTEPSATCPPNSFRQGAFCRCNAGYRTTDQRTCVRLTTQLVGYIGAPTGAAPAPLRNEDCTALYTGPVQLYGDTRCQCLSFAFVRPDGVGCWYKLNISLANPASTSNCPPNSVRGVTDYCRCEPGFEQNGDECVPKNVELYEYTSVSAVNTTGLTNADCEKVFSPAAQIYPGRFYCVCKNGAFRVRSNTGCSYRIGFNNTEIKTAPRCPEHADAKQDGNHYTCLCQEGYQPASDQESCQTSNITLSGTRDPSTAASNCVRYKDADCHVKFGSAAQCYNETCYCNRRTSYINADNRCESFSAYIFPGPHEYQSHTCMIDKDCGEDGNVECAKLTNNARHKVCRCVDGAFLDPKSGKCVTNRCEPPCNTANNFECRDDRCVCKSGFVPNGNACVENNYKLTLNERCDTSASLAAMIDTAKNDYLMCDARCFRARCIPGYRPDDKSCVRYQLEKDSCVYEKEDVCGAIGPNAFCDRDSNRCTCRPSFYQIGDECARAVNSRCVNDNDCGGNMRCEGQRCQCNADQRTEDGEDVYGRPIQRCIGNGTAMSTISLVMMLMAMISSRLFLH